MKSYTNVESLKRALKKAWKDINWETLTKIVDNFPKRLKACVDANGSWFERSRVVLWDLLFLIVFWL